MKQEVWDLHISFLLLICIDSIFVFQKKMFLLSTPSSISLMIILAILLPLSRASINFDERRLARALRQRLLESNSDLLSGEFDYVKRSESDISDRILNDPAALRDYLRQINEYFAIIGRPRLVYRPTKHFNVFKHFKINIFCIFRFGQLKQCKSL